MARKKTWWQQLKHTKPAGKLGMIIEGEPTVARHTGYGQSNIHPSFEVTHKGDAVGFIQRGHVEIDQESRKHGVFTKWLHGLEELEKNEFRKGKFSKYKHTLLEHINIMPGYMKYNIGKTIFDIETIREPSHIDFTTVPETAAALLLHGYSLGSRSKWALEDDGLIKNASKREQMRFLLDLQKTTGATKHIIVLIKKVSP